MEFGMETRVSLKYFVIGCRDDKDQIALFNQFKTCRNIINKLIKIIKASYYQKYFHEHKRNILKTWNRIKYIINVNQKEQENINCLTVDDQEVTNPLVINYHNW